MPNAADSLLFATAAGFTAAAAVTAFGLRREPPPGWRWWVAALWFTTLGAALALLPAQHAAAALSAPLLQQWPLLTLLGLRQFHARQHWPASARADLGVLLATTLGALAAQQGALAASPWALVACGLVSHLYAGAVMFTGPAGRDAPPVLGLGATAALLSFAPGLAALGADIPGTALAGGGPADAAHVARALAAALGALVLAFVSLILVFERIERQLRDSRRRLRLLANLDALTQVPNRRHFNELAGHALRHDPPGSAVLLLFDIDHFKQINDRLGHAAGDRALCLVAGSVVEHLRTHDAAGRHGGDEFVLLLRRATTQDAMGVAARIVAEVQRRAEPTPLPALSLSFGMVQLHAGEDIDAALRRADQALYEAKRQGRSRAVAALGNEDRPVFSESRRLGLLPA